MQGQAQEILFSFRKLKQNKIFLAVVIYYTFSLACSLKYLHYESKNFN